MKFLKLFGHLIIILLLAVLTQVVGIIWIITLWLSYKFKKAKLVSSCYVDGSYATVEKGIFQDIMSKSSIKQTAVYQ